MAKRRASRNMTIRRRIQGKLVVLIIFVLLAFAGLGLKLLFINMTKGEQYKKTVLSQ